MPVSLNGTLATARSALSAHQAALQVVSDNIANATTPGYTRKRAELVAGTPQVQPEGMFGTGVLVRNVTQARDRFLDASHRASVGSQAHFGVRSDYLAQVESVFGEPGDTGLAATFDAFWSSWSDLANDPLNSAARGVVRERGNQLATHFNRVADAVATLAGSTAQRLQTDLGQANQLAAQVAELNGRIVAAEAGGMQAGQLRDARDLALDQLATLAPVQVIERGNGAVAVAVEGVNLVDGVDHATLAARYEGGTWRVESSSGTTLAAASGRIGGYLSLLNGDLKQLQTDLDTLAARTVAAVNDVHRTGTAQAADGSYTTGIDFFAPAGAGAAGMRLSDAVQASAAAVAAGTPVDVAGVPTHAAGRSDVARALAELRHSAPVPADPADPDAARSLGERYDRLVTGLGVAVRAATDTGAAHGTLAEQSATMRDSIMGVATDEELVELIQLQSAYAAAARVVTTADEMLRTLIDLKR